MATIEVGYFTGFVNIALTESKNFCEIVQTCLPHRLAKGLHLEVAVAVTLAVEVTVTLPGAFGVATAGTTTVVGMVPGT